MTVINVTTAPSLFGWAAEGVNRYLGRMSHVRPAIAVSSVYVMPSYLEGTPHAVLEAIAMGRSIITVDAPDCRETVVDGEHGLLVRVRSVEALAATMELFVADSGLASRMGKRSRQIAKDE